MKVLVTGASGFVGTNLLFTLDDHGHEPVAFVRNASKIPECPDAAAIEEGDVTDRSAVQRAVEGHDCDAVVHLAAMHGRYGAAETEGGPDREMMERVNVTGSANVFDAAAGSGVDSVVFAGTLHSHPRLSDADDSDYVVTKRRAQNLLDESNYEFDHTVVNPAVVVGPRDYRLVHYTTYQLVCSNRLLVPPMYIPKRINLIHVDDVTESIVHYLRNPTGNCELLTGHNTSMRRYCRAIATASDSRCHVVPMPFARSYLPGLLDALHEYGPLPVSSQMFNWSDRSVPADLCGMQPQQPRTVATIAEDTYTWYAEMELL